MIVALLSALAGALTFAAALLLTEKPRPVPEITPEQARAALLELRCVRAFTGGEDDPAVLELKQGAIVRVSDSVVKIGRFFSCNLKEKTWRMGYGIPGDTPKRGFSVEAEGRFECPPNGTWRAVGAITSIT